MSSSPPLWAPQGCRPVAAPEMYVLKRKVELKAALARKMLDAKATVRVAPFCAPHLIRLKPNLCLVALGALSS